MDPKNLIELAQRAVDVAATDSDATRIDRVEIIEAADGSRRTLALVETHDPISQLDQTYRLGTPAPEDAPPWARREYPGWTVEVRTGDESWLTIADVELRCACGETDTEHGGEFGFFDELDGTVRCLACGSAVV